MKNLQLYLCGMLLVRLDLWLMRQDNSEFALPAPYLDGKINLSPAEIP